MASHSFEQQRFIALARQRARLLWDTVNALKAMQSDWNALNYGATLEDGTGANVGYTKDEVGPLVFAATDQFYGLLTGPFAKNVANML